MNKKYGDIGFCIKSEKGCKLKSCFRHICHNSNPLSITFADYEGSECCLKNKEIKDNEKLD